MQIICAWCEVLFTKTRYRTKFCSRRCCLDASNRAYRIRKLEAKRVYAACLFCDKQFAKKRFDQIYCSKECCRAKYKVVLPPTECQSCKEVFVPIKTYQKFCSYRCKYRDQNGRRKIVLDPIECHNERCKVLFAPKGTNNIYCSRSCAEPPVYHPAIACRFCEKVFNPKRITHRCCSVACHRKLRYKNLSARNCLFCNELFVPRKEVHVCCSTGCRIKFDAKRAKERRQYEHVSI